MVHIIYCCRGDIEATLNILNIIPITCNCSADLWFARLKYRIFKFAQIQSYCKVNLRANPIAISIVPAPDENIGMPRILPPKTIDSSPVIIKLIVAAITNDRL